VCNDFGNNVPYDAYLRAFSQIRVPVVFPKAAPNLEPRDDIWPTETAPVFRRREEGVEMAQLRWGLPAGAAEGSAGHQFPLRGAAVPQRTLPHPGVALLRVHRREIAEIQVEIHQTPRGLVLLRWPLAPDGRWGRGSTGAPSVF
jgi:putative SOS response-associated peptidase YedK